MQPKIYFSDTHQIDRNRIDRDALTVLSRLREAGFTAYLVGGSVRDLLVGQIPKDFDISTSAKPEEIKAIFQRSCILIGRRFRLAHIRFGHKIIEVATFRTGENDSDLILSDNEWGSPEEDVLRRDFTVNGLFYDSANDSIIDYVGGWEDIQTRILRTIGNPAVRFKQDPVRMLRLYKFQARFAFTIHKEAEEAAKESLEEIHKSSPARVLEELFRMLESGSAEPFFRILAEKGMLGRLFPGIMHAMRSSQGKKIFHYLACADKIRHHNKDTLLDRGILCSCLIFPILESEIEKQFLKKNHIPHIGEITLTVSSLLKDYFIVPFPHFPRRILSSMIAILVDQYRLTPLTHKRHLRDRFFYHKNFAYALNFLKIRALVDEKWVETYTSTRNHYRQIQKQHPRPETEELLPQKRRRRRRAPRESNT